MKIHLISHLFSKKNRQPGFHVVLENSARCETVEILDTILQKYKKWNLGREVIGCFLLWVGWSCFSEIVSKLEKFGLEKNTRTNHRWSRFHLLYMCRVNGYKTVRRCLKFKDDNHLVAMELHEHSILIFEWSWTFSEFYYCWPTYSLDKYQFN